MQKKMIKQMIATSTTRPMASPAAAPVLSPLPLLLCLIPVVEPEFGGTVGVMVTVWTWPVTVMSEIIGVGVHVEEDGDEPVVCVSSAAVVDEAFVCRQSVLNISGLSCCYVNCISEHNQTKERGIQKSLKFERKYPQGLQKQSQDPEWIKSSPVTDESKRLPWGGKLDKFHNEMGTERERRGNDDDARELQY
jgi:hypothetical protein